MDIGLIDFLLVAIVALVTWCVAAEGAFGAGTIFLSVVMSGLLAMNFFEPLAAMIEGIGLVGPRADVIALLGLFAVLVTLMRLACEKLSPIYISLQGLAHDIGSWGFGALTGYVTMAILLTALHTAPLPRQFLGFSPARSNLFGLAAPDRQWLGFTQYVTEMPFSKTVIFQDPAFGRIPSQRIFDGRTAYLWGLDDTLATGVLEKAGKPNASRNSPEIAKAAASIVMPSFIIRYADRRGGLYGGGGGGASQAPSTSTPSQRMRSQPTGPRF